MGAAGEHDRPEGVGPGRRAVTGSRGDGARVRKRSVVVAGHRTSVSLEDAFWQALTRIAAERGRSINALVTEVDRERQGALSSALRVYVLETLTGRR